MDIALQRIANHHIGTYQLDTPVDTVIWMGAMQAQDYGQALWALGLRTKQATRTSIEAAITQGTILRTWPMRGTIHFVPAEDAKWMLNLSGPKLIAADKRRMASLELTEATIDRSAQLLHDALHGQQPVARPTLMKLLEDAGITTTGQRGYHILWRLSLAGLLCIGPMEGKQQTFAWLSDWAPKQRSLDREPALAELAKRYMRSHGPATVQDFANWTGQNLTDCKRAIAAIRSELSALTIEGREYLYSTDTAPAAKSGDVHVLPGFDEYLLGYKNRQDILHADHAAKVVPGGNGIFLPMIISDGQVIGTWKRTIKTKSIAVEVQPFTKVSSKQKQHIETALQHYSEFMGLPVTIKT